MNKNIVIIGILLIISMGLVSAAPCDLSFTDSAVDLTGFITGYNSIIDVSFSFIVSEWYDGAVCSDVTLSLTPVCDCSGGYITFQRCNGEPYINIYTSSASLGNITVDGSTSTNVLASINLEDATITITINGNTQGPVSLQEGYPEGNPVLLEFSESSGDNGGSINVYSATASNCPPRPIPLKIAEGNEYFYMQPITPTYANGYIYLSGETGTLYQLTAQDITAQNVYPLISVVAEIGIPYMQFDPINNTRYMYAIDSGTEWVNGGIDNYWYNPILYQYTFNGTRVAQSYNISTWGAYMDVDENYLYIWDDEEGLIKVFDADNITNLLNTIDLATIPEVYVTGLSLDNNILYVLAEGAFGSGIIQINDAARLANPSYDYVADTNKIINGDIGDADILTIKNNRVYIFLSNWLYQLDANNVSRIIGRANTAFVEDYYDRVEVGGGHVYIPGEAWYISDDYPVARIYGDDNPFAWGDETPDDCLDCELAFAIYKLDETNISVNPEAIITGRSGWVNPAGSFDNYVQAKPLYHNNIVYAANGNKLYQIPITVWNTPSTNINSLKSYPVSGIYEQAYLHPEYADGSIFMTETFTLDPPFTKVMQLDATDITTKIAEYTFEDHVVLTSPININDFIYWGVDGQSTLYWFTGCTERWYATCVLGQTVWVDARGCGTTTNKPADGASCCTEMWQARYNPTSCVGVSNQTKYYIDLAYCGTTGMLPGDNGTVIACGSGHSYANVVGWDLLMNGQPAEAAFTALNVPLGGWLIFILWFVISMVIISKGNWEISAIIGLIFLALFLTAPWFTGWQIGAAITWMVFQLAIVLFRVAAKEKNY